MYIFSSHLHHSLKYGRSCLQEAFFESSKHCHPRSSSHQSMGCNLYKGCVDLSHWSHKQLMAGATPAEPLQPPTKSLLSNCLLCFVFSTFNRANLNVLLDRLFIFPCHSDLKERFWLSLTKHQLLLSLWASRGNLSLTKRNSSSSWPEKKTVIGCYQVNPRLGITHKQPSVPLQSEFLPRGQFVRNRS